MSESDPLRGSLAKIDRAGAHLDTLYNEIRAFHDLPTKAYRFISKVDVETSRYLMRVLIEKPLPVEWSLIVGDFVNNLRAALDHMVWEFVQANGQKPSVRNAFPIFDYPVPVDPGDRSRKRWDGMVGGISAPALALVESCQPHLGEDGPRSHLLHALRELSNEDKHRVVLASFGAIEQPSGALDLEIVEVTDVRPLQAGQLHAGMALKHGSLVFEAPVEITGPNPQVKANAKFPMDIGFGDPIVPLKGLRQMIEVVAQIVGGTARQVLGAEPLVGQFGPPPN